MGHKSTLEKQFSKGASSERNHEVDRLEMWRKRSQKHKQRKKPGDPRLGSGSYPSRCKLEAEGEGDHRG